MTYPCVCVFGRLVLQTNKRYTTLYERNIQKTIKQNKTNRKVENEQKLFLTLGTRTRFGGEKLGLGKRITRIIPTKHIM